MIDPIRFATPEELEGVKEKGDLTSGSSVVVFGNSKAVIRHCVEVDPIFFDPNEPRHKRALMLWGIANALRLQGVAEFYFNVKTEDKDIIEDFERLGAIKTSTGPEFRFKVRL